MATPPPAHPFGWDDMPAKYKKDVDVFERGELVREHNEGKLETWWGKPKNNPAVKRFRDKLPIVEKRLEELKKASAHNAVWLAQLKDHIVSELERLKKSSGGSEDCDAFVKDVDKQIEYLKELELKNEKIKRTMMEALRVARPDEDDEPGGTGNSQAGGRTARRKRVTNSRRRSQGRKTSVRRRTQKIRKGSGAASRRRGSVKRLRRSRQ
jgi:hypothetical protein